MADTNIGSSGQAPQSNPGQAPTTPTGQAPEGTSQNSNQPNNNGSGTGTGTGQANNQGQGQGQGTGEISPARLAELLAEARQEAANHRIEANKLKEAQRVADESKLLTDKKFEELANKRQETIDSLAKEIAVLKREKDINKILSDHKLPLELAISITGNTKEEMEASAKLLAKHVVAPPAPNTEGGNSNQQRRPAGPGQGGNNNQGQQQTQRKYAFQQPGEVPWPI